VAANRTELALAAHVPRGSVEPGARRRAVTVLGLLLAGAVVVWLGAPTCPTALFLGIPCPGCGLTRATFALFAGDFAGALRFHPLSPLLVPIFIGAMSKALVDHVRGSSRGATDRPSFWTGRAGIALASVLLALVVGVWALRFFGFFGGPVPVKDLAYWRARLAPSASAH
jgi:hypothetical protein